MRIIKAVAQRELSGDSTIPHVELYDSKQRKPAAPDQTGAVNHEGHSTAMKILVVDDDEAVRTGLRCVLVSEGYEVRVACNGLEAVQDLEKAQADLILVDMNMPELNGWATIAGLRGI